MEIKKENIEKLLTDYKIEELKKLLEDYYQKIDDILDDKIKNNIPINEYCEKIEPYNQKVIEINVAISLKKDIKDVSFHWDDKNIRYGIFFPIDTFVFNCEHDILKDNDGRAFYATLDLVSDLEIYPSIAKMGFFRKDFKYVLWLEYPKMPKQINI